MTLQNHGSMLIALNRHAEALEQYPSGTGGGAGFSGVTAA